MDRILRMSIGTNTIYVRTDRGVCDDCKSDQQQASQLAEVVE